MPTQFDDDDTPSSSPATTTTTTTTVAVSAAAAPVLEIREADTLRMQCNLRMVSKKQPPSANPHRTDINDLGSWNDEGKFLNFGTMCTRWAHGNGKLCKVHASAFEKSGGKLKNGYFNDGKLFTPETTTRVFETLLKTTTDEAKRKQISDMCDQHTLQELTRRQAASRERKAASSALLSHKAAAAEDFVVPSPLPLDILKDVAIVKRVNISGILYVYHRNATDLKVPMQVFNCESGRYVGKFDRLKQEWIELLSTCDPDPHSK